MLKGELLDMCPVTPQDLYFPVINGFLHSGGKWKSEEGRERGILDKGNVEKIVAE